MVDISKNQAIILLKTSDAVAGGDKKGQCFFNGIKLAKAALGFKQLEGDFRFQIVGDGPYKTALIDTEILERIAGITWVEAKALREVEGMGLQN